MYSCNSRLLLKQSAQLLHDVLPAHLSLNAANRLRLLLVHGLQILKIHWLFNTEELHHLAGIALLILVLLFDEVDQDIGLLDHLLLPLPFLLFFEELVECIGVDTFEVKVAVEYLRVLVIAALILAVVEELAHVLVQFLCDFVLEILDHEYLLFLFCFPHACCQLLSKFVVKMWLLSTWVMAMAPLIDHLLHFLQHQ